MVCANKRDCLVEDLNIFCLEGLPCYYCSKVPCISLGELSKVDLFYFFSTISSPFSYLLILCQLSWPEMLLYPCTPFPPSALIDPHLHAPPIFDRQSFHTAKFLYLSRPLFSLNHKHDRGKYTVHQLSVCYTFFITLSLKPPAYSSSPLLGFSI